MVGKSVLIFFADETLSYILKTFFERDGWIVCSAGSTDGLTTLLVEVAPTLILMDQNILPMGGITAARKIKNKLETSHIPIIFFSKSLDIEMLSKSAGADNFIEYPFECEDLLKMGNELCLKISNNAVA